MNPPVLEAIDLHKRYRAHAGFFGSAGSEVRAVDGVSLRLGAGETLALVGESGCGKSTVGRMLVRLTEPTSGEIRLGAIDLLALNGKALREQRRTVQMIFQDPSASLNPKLRAGDLVAEPIENFVTLSKSSRRKRLEALFANVGLRSDAMQKYPFEFSGGQKQRLGIARALGLSPSIIVADEPVSALDVSVQAQIINLMMDLQERMGLAYLFISHDLAVVEHIAHRVAVMYLGKIVESAPKRRLFDQPRHPYTQGLIASAPAVHPRLKKTVHLLEGDIPSPTRPPPGCAFHTRCPLAVERCKIEAPEERTIDQEHSVRCHLA
jgi:oligopeptide/dipeptide ABC transporter ATP-binding protein